MRARYSELLTLSSNNATTAAAIVQQSIDNEWSGLFPLKQKQYQENPDEDMFDRERRLLKEARARRKSIEQNQSENGN